MIAIQFIAADAAEKKLTQNGEYPTVSTFIRNTLFSRLRDRCEAAFHNTNANGALVNTSSKEKRFFKGASISDTTKTSGELFNSVNSYELI